MKRPMDLIRTTMTVIPLAVALVATPTGSFSNPADCTTHADKPDEHSDMIRVSADLIRVTGVENTVALEGRPVVTEGDLCLSANSILATYEEGTGKLLAMSAADDVSVAKGADHATGDSARYDVEAQTVVLLGNVTLTSDGAIVNSQKLTIDLENETLTLEGKVESDIDPVPGE